MQDLRPASLNKFRIFETECREQRVEASMQDAMMDCRFNFCIPQVVTSRRDRGLSSLRSVLCQVVMAGQDVPIGPAPAVESPERAASA